MTKTSPDTHSLTGGAPSSLVSLEAGSGTDPSGSPLPLLFPLPGSEMCRLEQVVQVSNDLGALDTDASANIQVTATVSDYDKPVDIQSPVSSGPVTVLC